MVTQNHMNHDCGQGYAESVDQSIVSLFKKEGGYDYSEPIVRGRRWEYLGNESEQGRNLLIGVPIALFVSLSFWAAMTRVIGGIVY